MSRKFWEFHHRPLSFCSVPLAGPKKNCWCNIYMNDSDKILKSAGVYHRCGHEIPAALPSGNKPNAMQTCLICFDDTDKMMQMPCGHAFCLDCWSDFCKNAVDEGPLCVVAACPHMACTEVVTEDEMHPALSPTPAVLAKFKNFQLRSFVESSPFTRWCPGRGCERVAYALSPAAMETEGSVMATAMPAKRNFALSAESNRTHRPVARVWPSGT
jgi:hypothetical protein